MNKEEKSKALIKGTGIYAIGTIGTKFLSFIIVPIYTYYISTGEMGIYDILLSTVNLLVPVVTIQISDAAYRYIIREDADSALYIRNTYYVLLTNCAAAFALILLFNMLHSIPHCLLFAPLLCLTCIMETMQKLLRALKKQFLFAISGIIYSIIFLSLNVFQVCYLRTGIEGMLKSGIAACLFTIAIIAAAEPRLRPDFHTGPDLNTIKEMGIFSIPLIPNYLNWWIINSSDRYIVLFFLGSAANGILAIAHKFPTILHLMLNLFTISWQDVSVAEKGEDKEGYNTKVFRRFYIFAFGFLLFLIPATKAFIHLVMSSDYKIAGDYVAFFYLGTVFQSFSSFYGVGYLRNKNTKQAFYTSVYGAIINALVNLATIKFIGLHAASISTMMGFLVMWIVRERQNREEMHISIKKAEFISLFLVDILVAILSIFFSWKINLAAACIGGLFFALLNISTLKQLYGLLKKKK